MAEKKIKKPVEKGAARVPVVMQLEALECGAACLTMIMAYYGKWVPLEQVRYDCGVSRDGSNAKNVLIAARNYGFEAGGYKFEPESLKKEGTFPCIVHWNFEHFIVVNGFKGNKVYVNDPAKGFLKMSMEDFDRGFTGIVLMMEPGENFVADGKKKSTLSFARNRLKGAGGAVLFVVLTSVITCFFTMINPAMTKVFLDHLLSGKNPEWLIPFIFLMSVFAFCQILVQGINTIYSLKINGKLAAIGNTSYMWKILKMPMGFFTQRLAGDLMQRQQTNATIAASLVNTFAPLLLNTGMMIFYLFIMLRYSPILTAVGILTVILNLFVARTISERRVNLTRVMMRDSGKLSSETVTGISMAETIKASGAENGFFQKWAGLQASVNTQMVSFTKNDNVLGMLPDIFVLLADQTVLFLGLLFTMNGHFTLGMVTAFQGYLTCFMDPAMTLIEAGQTIQEMRTEMERIEDVMEYPDDPYAEERAGVKDGEYSKLSGQIELKDVTFGYSRLSKPLIENFSMKVEPGSRVAFVGASGCGKSTLSNLISGLYIPWSGEILFDGKKISEIDRSIFTGSVAVVDQDIILFEDTIENNIKMWDSSIEDFEMILAARDASLHEDIVKRPGSYSYKLTEGGTNLSGGQRQRMEIARVLSQDPSIIILDEATSALDAKTEAEVVRAIKDRGITCIVIAHRLSTIRDCDEILVMDHGTVVERGTHDELYKKGGYYTELVTNE